MSKSESVGATEVWEYKLETSADIGVDKCLAQGRDGWRVCAVSGSTWVFGRPVHAQRPAVAKCSRCGRGGRSEENGDRFLCMDCAGEEVNAAVNHACRAPGIGIVTKGRVSKAFDMLRKQVERIREKCLENAAEFSDSASSEDHASARLCKVITGLVDAAERDAMGWA